MLFILAGLVGVLIIALMRQVRWRRHGEAPGGGSEIERTVTAFLVAPLIASAVALIVSFSAYGNVETALVFASITATLGYFGAVALGIPAYLFLRWWNLTSSWISAALGALIAMSTGFAIWGNQVHQDFPLLLGITGALGTIAGLAFWSITRPDQRHGT